MDSITNAFISSIRSMAYSESYKAFIPYVLQTVKTTFKYTRTTMHLNPIYTALMSRTSPTNQIEIFHTNGIYKQYMHLVTC